MWSCKRIVHRLHFVNMRTKKEEKHPAIVVVLHNIRSSHNVGSVFRTADATGVTKIFLTGITARPVDRFGRAQKEIAKTALGAEAMIQWEHSPRIGAVLKNLKKEGFCIVAVEQAPGAREYTTLKRAHKTALVFGSEIKGLSKSILQKSDIVAKIPMHGRKESLNVSVAAGIILFHFVQ